MIFFIHGAGCTADACPVADSLDALLGPMNRLGYSSAETWEASWASLKSQTAGAGNNALFIGESMGGFWAAQLSRLYDARCYLLNPVIRCEASV